MKALIYKLLKYSNDLNAISKGKIVTRVVRRESGGFYATFI